jgi:hypothetical protein
VSAARTLALVVALALAVGACHDGSDADRVPARASTTTASAVYMAIGGAETAGTGLADGVRDAWPQVLYRTALPVGTVFYNLGERAGLEASLGEVILLVGQLRPTLVTVWVPADRALASDAPALDSLLRAARRGGAARVLVADTAPAVAAVARRNGATVIAVPGTPSTPAQHAAVASRFAAALR